MFLLMYAKIKPDVLVASVVSHPADVMQQEDIKAHPNTFISIYS